MLAELERPDATTTTLALGEVEPGVFEATETASLSGIHYFRVLASGTSIMGHPFTREQTMTAAVWQGGDNPALTGRRTPEDGLLISAIEKCCRFAKRLIWLGIVLLAILAVVLLIILLRL